MNELTDNEMASIDGSGFGFSVPPDRAQQSIWMIQQEDRGVLPREATGDLH